jgi:hypothetical protein
VLNHRHPCAAFRSRTPAIAAGGCPVFTGGEACPARVPSSTAPVQTHHARLRKSGPAIPWDHSVGPATDPTRQRPLYGSATRNQNRHQNQRAITLERSLVPCPHNSAQSSGWWETEEGKAAPGCQGPDDALKFPNPAAGFRRRALFSRSTIWPIRIQMPLLRPLATHGRTLRVQSAFTNDHAYGIS